MPINRNALMRYKVIDRMLRHGKEATLDELIFACTDELRQEISYASVSWRTVQHDLQEMRYSELLGYYAPIVVVNRKFYCYEDPDYTIAKVPLSSDDLLRLTEAVDLLKQMSASKGFMLMQHRCEDVVAGMFGDIWKAYGFSSDNILKNTLDMISLSGEVGY